MTQGHLRKLLYDTRFSPEQLAPRIGISGMTLRRWADLPEDERIPEVYEKAVHEAVYELLAEGILPKESEVVEVVLKESDQALFNAAIKNVGFSPDFAKSAKPDSDSVLKGMSQIGAQKKKQESVERSRERISSFARHGREWKERLRTLNQVIKSTDLKSVDKFAAYGALFYLLTPFDLIPDHIPVFGLLDDFFILGIVAVYYANRFPHLFNNKSKQQP